MRRTARVLGALALAGAAAPLVVAAPAHAHATMVATSPEEGAVLDALPAQVSFAFSEPMDPVAYVVVTAPDGTALADGDPVVDGEIITQAVDDSGDGTYLMAVKAVSQDGHPLTGRVEFVVGEASEPLTTTGDEAAAAPTDAAATASGTDAARAPRGSASWGGRPPWVWLVGPGFLLAGAGMWFAGRRSTSPIEADS